MSTILSGFSAIVFLILSGIHFNWFLGGKFGFEKSLPTKEDGTRVLNPKRIESAIVGLGLLLFAIYYSIVAGLISYNLPSLVSKYAGWIIATIFVVRAIGDFRYVGFFKKIRKTTFGKFDSKYFSPFCIFIGLIGFVIEMIK